MNLRGSLLGCDWRSASTRAVLCPILGRSLTRLRQALSSFPCSSHRVGAYTMIAGLDLVKQRRKLAKAISSLHSAAPNYLRPQTLHGYALPLNETGSGILQSEFTHKYTQYVGCQWPSAGSCREHLRILTPARLFGDRPQAHTIRADAAADLRRPIRRGATTSLAARILLDSGTFDSTKPDWLPRTLCLRRRPQVVLIGSRRAITAGSGVL